MNVILTSCGLETQRIEKLFTDMLPKSPSETKLRIHLCRFNKTAFLLLLLS